MADWTTQPFHDIMVGVYNHTATLTMNRPKRKNALSPRMVNELITALTAANADPEIRVVVLQGAGSVFCAGGDLGSFSDGNSSPDQGGFPQLIATLDGLATPTIAKVRSFALGGGLALVAACHFAIADQDASFATPEIRRGLFPFVALIPILRLVPRRRAFEMMLLGDRVGAREAVEIGLINRTVEGGEIEDVVQQLAAKLAKGPSGTISMGLRSLHRTTTASDAADLEGLWKELEACLDSPDAQEGLAAFQEGRAPKFGKPFE